MEQDIEDDLETQNFSNVKIRKGQKQFNENINRTTIQRLADYKVSTHWYSKKSVQMILRF